jgi:hypothetical protein
VDGEHPRGEALAKRLRAELPAHGMEIVDVDNWRDCGWCLSCVATDVALEVVVTWEEGAADWFLQLYPSDPLHNDDGQACTRAARAVTDALSSLGDFSNFRWAIDGDPADGGSSGLPQLPTAASSAPIQFPAIAVSEGDSFMVLRSLPQSGTARAIGSGYFRRLCFFDSGGLLWRVVAVHLENAPGLVVRFLNRTMGVGLFVGQPEPNRLGEVAASLCLLIDRDADDLYAQQISRDDLKEKVRKARTPQELIAAAENLHG